MNNWFFYCLVLGFTAGIFLSSFFKIGFSFFLFLLILSLIIYLYGRIITKNNSKIILISIFIFSFSLGILRYEIKETRLINTDLSGLVGEKVSLQGIIIAEPSIKDQGAQLIVHVKTDKILVSTGLFPAFRYGDLINIDGKLDKIKNFQTETGVDFDYIGFLAKEDIYYQISFAQTKFISANNGSYFKSRLFSFKNTFMEKINLVIKEPESSLLGGLLLGAKNSLGKDLQLDFRQAGVSHIVALSGYNITIVAESIMIVLSFLPMVFSMSFGVLGIIFFAIMTGASATVIRASIMALLVLLARYTNRKYDITRALILAGVFMLIQNPKILVFDLSFQLSFLATIALIYISPLIDKKLSKITNKFKIREILVATISTQIFVLPFILYKMGTLPIYSLFANILILPIVSPIMLFGFLTGMVGLLSLTLSIPLAYISSLLLSYSLSVIDFIAHLPFSSVAINYFPASLMFIIYFIFIIIIWRINRSLIKQNEK
jgi:competence protein ComEC